jgi:hypothetical protein
MIKLKKYMQKYNIIEIIRNEYPHIVDESYEINIELIKTNFEKKYLKYKQKYLLLKKYI